MSKIPGRNSETQGDGRVSRKSRKELTVAEVIARRKMKLATREGYISLFWRVVFLAAFGYLFFTQVFLVTQAVGADMFPAVKDGDLVIGYRLQQEYARDDIVVFTLDGEQKIGRIAAMQGDSVEINEQGTMLVNGSLQAGEILYPTYPKEGLEYPYTVPDGCAFILADYRTRAEDSRDFGAVTMEDVEAKVITILRRRGL